jgi:exonuclease III
MRDLVQDNACTVVCLQETKLQSVDDGVITSTLGPQFLPHYAALPAAGTCGGIIVACSQDEFAPSEVDVRRFAVTAKITRRGDNESWSITGVYGPQSDNDKLTFMEEMRQISHLVHDRWLLLSDFNLICKASDKTNDRVNRRLISSLRALQD